MKTSLYFSLLIFMIACGTKDDQQSDQPTDISTNQPITKWSNEKAWEWYNSYPWLVGANFNPSTSINQLEFWQEDTFDPETIDRELGWSASIGMNAHRVYLHNLLWDQDSTGFIERLETYLDIAEKHDILTMFVLLDDVWHPVPKLGKQPDPVPHLHNSGWVQAPGAAILGDTSRHDELEGYIKGVVSHFANDKRVFCWDIYNEPDNVAYQEGRYELEVKEKAVYSLALLKKVFRWAREASPSQPLTTGLWRGDVEHWGNPEGLPEIDRYMVENSDVISFHAYDGDMEIVKKKIEELKVYGLPMLCTEYVARGGGNTFQSVMPILKENGIAAFNWGLVSGKTQTIYPWASWSSEFTEEPEIWHHDVFRADGTPYSDEEVAFIKEITGRGD